MASNFSIENIVKTYAVQFVVEAARVAHRFPVGDPPPEGRLAGAAVRAERALATARRLQNLFIKIINMGEN